MDEQDHKVFFFEKETSEDIDIKPTIVKVLDNEEEVRKEIQDLHLKKGDKIKYEFRVHLVAE
jgi:hypothetical protein